MSRQTRQTRRRQPRRASKTEAPKKPQAKKTAGRVAEVKVYRPTHVPPELMGAWTGAAQQCARTGSLFKKVRTASGTRKAVNYTAINRTYRRVLAQYIDLSEQADAADAAAK